MQYTHDIDDDDFEYPEGLLPTDVHVYMHPSFMFATHDYSCPVCRENHAVLSRGIMQPCRKCQHDNWQLTKIDVRPWWQRLLNSQSVNA